jgi:hypothetical protein
MGRYNAKVDKNQSEIVAALRGIGASVELTHRVGNDFGDLIVGWAGRTYVMEVKQVKGRESPGQREARQSWRGDTWAVVRSVDDALEVLGVV